MSFCDQEPLFVSGTDGYHTYRIPALVSTVRGTLLAFCEGRRHGAGDAGHIDILLRRSADGGRTWDPPRAVLADPPHTCGNPAPVVDRRDGTIRLLFCKNRGDGPEAMIVQGRAPRTVWCTSSLDEGETWGAPREITADVKAPAWTWYATGPGHGIQLRGGRLVVPCDHVRGIHFERAKDPGHAHLLYSDDGGRTWRIGGIVGLGTNESVAVEDDAGRVYINCRSANGRRCRAYAWSDDQGEGFSPVQWDEALVDPVCQASAVRYTLAAESGRNRVLFSNAASPAGRERMTVRLSYDECRTWSAGRELYAGPSAYSDLAITPDGAVCCLYERGVDKPYETLTLARFDLPWLTHGADRL